MSLHILHTPMYEVKRERRCERFCFKCRKRHNGWTILMATVQPSYYDPVWCYACDGCGGDFRWMFS